MKPRFDELNEIGLSEIEAEVYVALLAKQLLTEFWALEGYHYFEQNSSNYILTICLQ